MTKIALVQQQASWDKQENLRRGERAFREAAAAGAQLVAFAELAFLRFLPQHPASLEALAQAETILNLLEKEGEKTFDSSPVIDADGAILGVIRMVHIMEGPGFHESGYYAPGDRRKTVFKTRCGNVGVAICYDRHFPEFMRGLALQGAEIVIVPQAGAVGEWTEGMFEAELQVAAFQNGYYAGLVNRVGQEEIHNFAGESFVVDPDGGVIARAPAGRDFILQAECDSSRIPQSFARRHFLPDRRKELYKVFGEGD
jgi:N-carbamoylputrescine amidase